MTTPAITLDAAYDQCQAITRREARNFYYAFLTLPKPRRRAIYAVYAFSRLADDIADEDGRTERKVEALEGCRMSLRSALAGNPEGPILTALADAANTYAIPEHLLAAIVDGVEMDLTRTRYATFDELQEYCHRVASAPGLVSIRIFGYTDPRAEQYAIDLGLAMQLTNIMRDIREDADRGRIYFPQDEIKRFGVTEEHLLAGIIDPAFVEMMRFQAARARALFDSGAQLFPLLNPRSRGCAAGLHHLYSKLLDRIERRGFDVFSERVSLPVWVKLRLTFTLWAASHLPRRQPT